MKEFTPEAQIPRITIQEAKARLDKKEDIFFLDVRRVPDDHQIQGSIRYEPVAVFQADHLDLGLPKENLIVPY